MEPTIGSIVLYALGQQDADEINRRRAGRVTRTGNDARAGDVYPAMIVRIFGDTPKSAVNLQVFLDGSDSHWATSRTLGEGHFHWAWPERV
ncbi:hypothetical protein [Streptomyces sp. NPDC004528]|uniref:hypothetical protein n=1 Tax=Streptomyces sp. NPDC004528 TaxID=3154550 RepID=UPI0033B73AF4